VLEHDSATQYSNTPTLRRTLSFRFVMKVMHILSRWEDVPLFDTEEAEAEFWADNKPEVRLMESSVAGPNESADSVTITLRMDPRMLARIKRLARSRYLNYQSMMKQWVSERMEQEMSSQAIRQKSIR
jgi:hypothetical protein